MLREKALTFGIVLFEQAEELDFVGPWEMATMWSKYADGPKHCVLVSQHKAPISCAKGMSVNPHLSFESCPQLDYLLVPGGEGTRREVGNPALLSFISSQARSCKAVLSVCTGAFLLHAAGLLSGKRATTHWGSLERLRALGDVQVVEERYVNDGNVWSSAGVSAGIDMLLAFIAVVAGADAAGKVQFGAEYYPGTQRYGGFDQHPKAPAYVRSI